MVASILGDSRKKNLKGMDAHTWCSILPSVALVCLLNLGVENISMLQNSCKSSTLHVLILYPELRQIQPLTVKISYPRYSDQSLAILANLPHS